jgi:hypothetical protein
MLSLTQPTKIHVYTRAADMRNYAVRVVMRSRMLLAERNCCGEAPGTSCPIIVDSA